MPRRSLRLAENLDRRVNELVQQRGYRSWSAFVVEAIREKSGRVEALDSMTEAEVRLAASFGQIMREMRSLHTSMQAQFALTDALTKYLLTCIVEPPTEMLEPARAKAKARYDRLLRAAAKTITGQVANSLYEVSDGGN
jgi:Arc/MetJ-type ribon-helix-helix transcriptional regulator